MQFASHFSFCSPANIASFASLSGTQSSLCPHHFAKTASQAAPGVSSGFQATTVQIFMWSLPGAQLELEWRPNNLQSHQGRIYLCCASVSKITWPLGGFCFDLRQKYQSFWIHIPGTMKKINNTERWNHLAQLALRNFSEVLWTTWRFHCSTFFWQTPGWIHFLPFPSVF